MCIDKIESSIHYVSISDNTSFLLRMMIHARVRVLIPKTYYYSDIMSSNRVIDLERIRDILCGR